MFAYIIFSRITWELCFVRYKWEELSLLTGDEVKNVLWFLQDLNNIIIYNARWIVAFIIRQLIIHIEKLENY